jgi:hypothetical protein
MLPRQGTRHAAAARARRAVPALASLVFASALCATANAAELEYRASAGIGTSDNVRRTAFDRVDETIGTAGLQFSLDHRSSRVIADVFGDLNYYNYLDGTYDPELVGNMYANGEFAIVPERFIWIASDQFGQVLTDPFQPATPDNRENINFATTGPDFTVGLGSQFRMRIGGRYTRIDYEKSPLDSTSRSGELGFIRELSDRSTVSLNGRFEKYEYEDESLDADFDQSEAYLRYETAGARTNIALNVGATKLERDSTNSDESGALLSLELSRRVSSSSVVSLTGGRRFSTAASTFASEQGISNVGLESSQGRQTPEPFVLDNAAVGWNYARGRSGLNVDLSWLKRSYEATPINDQSQTTLGARYRRELTPRSSIAGGISFAKVKYQPPSPDYDDIVADVLYSLHLTRNVDVELRYVFYDRTSPTHPAEYTENRIWLTIGWGHGDPRAVRAAPRFGIDSQVQQTGRPQ